MTSSLVAIDILPESALRSMVDVMVRLIEACGAIVIMIGAVVAIVKFAAALTRRDINQFSAVRLSLARFLVLGLEFQLAADVLRTAISPSFAEIGKLAAIAAIRTVLNYFLNREIAQEQREVESLRQPPRPASGGSSVP
ncbi:putative membrane protein [Mycobacterium sp. BK558]|nr:putative membrane protein [Mycobacterium sp. BK558]